MEDVDNDSDDGREREEETRFDESASAANSQGCSVYEFQQMKKYASKETKYIKIWRTIVGLSILGVGAVVGTFTYKILFGEQVSDSIDAFILFSNTIEDSFIFNVRSIFDANRALGRAITTAAITSNQTFPYVCVPAFEAHAFQARTTGIGVENIVYAPVVSNLDEWIRFSLNHFDWIEESKRIFDDLQPGSYRSQEPPTRRLPPVVWQYTDEGSLEPWEERGKIFIPSMHISPPPPKKKYVQQNINLFTFPDYKEVALAAVVLKDAVFSKFLVGDNSIGHQDSEQTTSRGRDSHLEPRSIAAQPVYKDLTRQSFSTDVGGYIFTIVAWERYLVNLIPEGVAGIILVLCNTCQQAVTYELNGHEARYVGEGDLHDPAYDNQKKTVTFSENYIDPDLASQVNGHCKVYLDVYPSKDFENAYHNNIPMTFTVIVAVLFVIMAALFVLYDRFVHYRNKKVLGAAARSNAIVASLFPSNVRDRLMEEREQQQEQNRMMMTMGSAVALKGFLSDKAADTTKENEDKNGIFKTKPIADLFPETTILFADIAGFTAWSSAREPVQVFMLLETFYHAFDAIAKRRRVFKVETIGDCYVAVCGLPDPCKDHAVRMVRFARDCMYRTRKLTQSLEITLGPDTGELSMRMGLHSGPVTAGVLRGERSRFQLFGDTMNTASRMESTGIKDCIHMSQETADLLIEAGRMNWIRPREDKVFAKGKGEMQTFFLQMTNSRDSSLDSYTHSYSSLGSSSFSDNVEKLQKAPSARTVSKGKLSRLVRWNLEVLTRFLKQIVARRKASTESTTAHTKQNMHNGDDNLQLLSSEGQYVRDEVAEFITLPQFDANAEGTHESMDSIQLDPAVISQLEEYISVIGSMYIDDNPFHNFEHAAHVALSVVKLLSRIVAASSLHSTVDEDLSGLHDHTYGITSDPLTQFSCILSALIHDLGHQGVSNLQLVREDAEIARVYKGKSVAEQNSVNIAWNLLMDKKYEQLRATIYANETEMRRFRQLLVNSVIATDIFDKDLKVLRNARWDKAFSAKNKCDEESQDTVNRKATIVIEHLIQASDVAHTMQHWHVYRKWNELFFKECYKAFRMGRGDSDPAELWYKGELGFFDFYIIPLAKKLKDCGVFGVSSDEYLNYAVQNRKEWEHRGRKIVEEMTEKAEKWFEASYATEDLSFSRKSDAAPSRGMVHSKTCLGLANIDSKQAAPSEEGDSIKKVPSFTELFRFERKNSQHGLPQI